MKSMRLLRFRRSFAVILFMYGIRSVARKIAQSGLVTKKIKSRDISAFGIRILNMVAGMSGPLPICPCGDIRQLIEYVHTLFRKTGNHSDGAENREHCRPLWRSPFAYSIRAYQSPLKKRNGERLFCFRRSCGYSDRAEEMCDLPLVEREA